MPPVVVVVPLEKLNPVPVRDAPLVKGDTNVPVPAVGTVAVPSDAPLVKGDVKVPPEVKPVPSGVLTLLLTGEVKLVLTG